MSLSKKEVETLLLLANQGPLTGYDMHSKKMGDRSGKNAETNIMSEPYWIKVRKKLLRQKMIAEYPEKGRRKPYILGENGFDYLVRNHVDSITEFEYFVEQCKEFFPLVFGFWEDLKAYGLADYVKNSLSELIYEIYFDIRRDLVLKKRSRYSHEAFVRDISGRIYVPELYSDQDQVDGEVFKKVKQFRNNNPEIKNFVKEWIFQKKTAAYQSLHKLEQIEKTLT